MFTHKVGLFLGGVFLGPRETVFPAPRLLHQLGTELFGPGASKDSVTSIQVWHLGTGSGMLCLGLGGYLGTGVVSGVPTGRADTLGLVEGSHTLDLWHNKTLQK